MRGASVAAAIVLLLVTGCGPSLRSAEDRFGSERLSDASVGRVAQVAADSTSINGEPPITISSVRTPGAEPGTVTVVADLEMAADSWDAAGRAAEFGSLLVPALMRNAGVTAVEVEFGSGGSRIVTFRFDRETAAPIHWEPMRKRFAERQMNAWHAFYPEATSYAWHDTHAWQDITSGGFPDSMSTLRLPQHKPAPN